MRLLTFIRVAALLCEGQQLFGATDVRLDTTKVRRLDQRALLEESVLVVVLLTGRRPVSEQMRLIVGEEEVDGALFVG